MKATASHATGDRLRLVNLSAGKYVMLDDLTIRKVPNQAYLTPSPFTLGDTVYSDIPIGSNGYIHTPSGINYIQYSNTFTQGSTWNVNLASFGGSVTSVDGTTCTDLSVKINGSWSHSSAGGYAGSFAIGTSAVLFHNHDMPQEMGQIILLDEMLTEAEVEGEAWAAGKRGPGRMGMGMTMD